MRACVRMCMCACMHACMCVCMHVCMYAYVVGGRREGREREEECGWLRGERGEERRSVGGFSAMGVERREGGGEV